MFWGCFSYDKKGPCHIWQPETATERKKAQAVINKLNKELKPRMREEWELNTGIRRMGLRNLPGPKPGWRFTEATGKLVRNQGHGGIDWWRYQASILIPKLLPFAQECLKERPNTIVQEDKAPAHAHQYQSTVYNAWNIQRLLWCGNSPDLNMIEPCWPHMKRVTTRKGAPQQREVARKVWQAAWRDLKQWRIQA